VHTKAVNFRTVALAVLIALAAAVVRLALNPLLGDVAPLSPFYVAILVATAYEGLACGILATFVSAVLGSWWLPPLFPLSQGTNSWLIMIMFTLVGLTISWFTNNLTLARQEAIRALAAQRQADRQVNLILETITDAFCSFDRAWRFVYVNQVALQWFGKERHELLGRTLWECFPNFATSAFEQRLRAAMNSGQNDHFDFLSESLGGWFEHRVYPTGDGLSVYSANVNDRKLEEERAELLLESERLARIESEHVARIKDEFLATLSHELRTPLNAILGWATLIRINKMNPEDLSAGIETIERNARAQAQMIDELLDLNRIISGKVRLTVQPVDLPAIVDAVLETVRPAATAKDIRLSKQIATILPAMMGDAARLQQVVWNLLSNAIKFTPKGGSVEVTLAVVESHVQLSVHDSGEGIRPDFLPHMFDRFRQSDSSTTRRHSGLGVGLAIVRHLVELHGGTVAAISAGEGHGTTMMVKLPVAPVNTESPEEKGTLTKGHLPVFPQTRFAELQGLKVLVVDDEPDAREFVKRILEESRAVVKTSPSAAVAFEVVQSFNPDVLISDIGMPEEDGYQLIRRVRASTVGKVKEVPAMALTAFARPEDHERSVAAGFQMHLVKPVERTKLLSAVATLGGRTEDHGPSVN
jgi:PAS domain S-box-containing protein